MQTSPRTLIIGLGNPLLRDDAVGLHVARRVRAALAGRDDAEVVEESCGGLRLMERMVGYDRAILIDAIRGDRTPGTVLTLDPREVHTQHSASAHDVNLPTALALGRRTGARLPSDDQLRIIAIEVEDVENFGEEMTPAVVAAIPRAAAQVLAEFDREREAR
ncbi:MAG TPA: hydrogenase maturation protease [Anaerolineales bacterium]|nr:hydrogenase maturation protease [Anaerolineales bacterium]